MFCRNHQIIFSGPNINDRTIAKPSLSTQNYYWSRIDATFINDFTQEGGGDWHCLDTMYVGLSKTGILVWQREIRKSPNLSDIINGWPLRPCCSPSTGAHTSGWEPLVQIIFFCQYFTIYVLFTIFYNQLICKYIEWSFSTDSAVAIKWQSGCSLRAI